MTAATFSVGSWLRRVLLALPFCFAVWWWAETSLILPGLAAVEGHWIDSVYDREQAQLQVLADGRWKIKTALLAPQANEKRALLVRVVYVDHVPNHTLGFPLLWALLLAVPYRRVRNLLLGTVLAFAAACASLWLDVYYRMALMMAAKEGPLWAQLPELRMPIHIDAYPDWFPTVMKAVSQSAVYAAALVVPLLLVYGLNKPFLVVQWGKKQENTLPSK
ncbi:MAG: hypothetical protein ACU837_06940 [Gammaproteobacteria bacterium]